MEMAYQYVWKYGLLGGRGVTTEGQTVEIVHPGRHNRDAGPDFSGARLRIDSQEWVGNVEVHTRASDWFRHGHDRDPAYGNVILHVVGEDDASVPDGRGGIIPQLSVPLSRGFRILYQRLAQKISAVECEPWLDRVPQIAVADWIDSLAHERIQRKAGTILETLAWAEGDWERTCFITLARSLGFSLNADPLEMTARTLPLPVLAAHSDDLMQLEAMVFGQAGMLDPSLHPLDHYYQSLCREYSFLMRMYGLRPLGREIWKYSKTRPQNSPQRRLALLAAACCGGFHHLSRLLENHRDMDRLNDLFDWQVSEYWLRNNNFGVPGSRLAQSLSGAHRRLLLINFAAPMLYAYGSSHGYPDLAEYGLELWLRLAPENNTYIRQWVHAGLPCRNAAESQALIQLRREYCDRNRCLECRFGYALLRKTLDSPGETPSRKK